MSRLGYLYFQTKKKPDMQSFMSICLLLLGSVLGLVFWMVWYFTTTGNEPDDEKEYLNKLWLDIFSTYFAFQNFTITIPMIYYALEIQVIACFFKSTSHLVYK